MRLGKKLYVSGGFGVLLAVLLFLDSGILLWALLACALHELGHYTAIRFLGGEMQRLSLTVVGAEMLPARQKLFSYGEEFVIVLAGPLVSLLTAMAAGALARSGWGEGCYLFCGLNLLLGLFNLLPILPLDGGRLLHILLLRRQGAQHWMTLLGRLVATLLLLGGVWLLRQGGGCTLLLAGAWLLAAQCRGEL